jgi:hypothetical protein
MNTPQPLAISLLVVSSLLGRHGILADNPDGRQDVGWLDIDNQRRAQ